MDKKPTDGWSIKTLRLDVEAAKNGKTWLLLPEGFRAQECGRTYPLPSRRPELELLTSIFIPFNKQDSGCLYLRRAAKKAKEARKRVQSATYDLASRRAKVKQDHGEFKRSLKSLKSEARQMVDEVRQEAQRQAASLNTLYDLTKRGLEGLIEAYLENKLWNGEKVTNAEFLAAGRIVTQTSKALGLPQQPGDSMAETVFDEYAAAIKETQETVALAPPSDDPEIEH
jgi:hypothetical protein